LAKNALCSALPEGLIFEEENAITEPTASVVKKITGFFLRITGKPTLTQVDKRYTAKIITTAYHDLANLPNPYSRIGFYSVDSASRIDRSVQARFLDMKLGSALLKSFGYNEARLNQAVSSAQTQNEMAANRGNNNYKHSVRIVDRNNLPSKLTILETQGGFTTELLDLEYESSDVSLPEHAGLMKYLLVSTEEDRYISLSDGAYSVSAGSYLIPYPFNDRIIYTQLSTPQEEIKLGVYYELANKKKKITYNVFEDKSFSLQILTPSESYFLLKDIPKEFEEIKKSYKYKGYIVDYRIVALKEDYGEFKKGAYLVAEDYVISMDNRYSLRKNSFIRFLPAAVGEEIVYNDDFFNSIRRYIAEKKREAKEASILNWVIEGGEDAFNDFILEPSRRPLRRT
ncbi:MAG: hypothetical protein AABX49_02255, partial [Nanoarchaeota archaeon]